MLFLGENGGAAIYIIRNASPNLVLGELVDSLIGSHLDLILQLIIRGINR